MKKVFRIMLVLLCVGSVAKGQERPDPNMPQGVNLDVPEGWEVRLDHAMDEVIIGSKPDSADIYFVNMTPGWHITTGPAAIFYHPANIAEGNYMLSTEIFLFDPGNRNREAFGFFFGGKSLQQKDQQYLYFLIRNTGEFLIKKRMGEETETVQGWTPSDAIVKYENTEESSVKNILSAKIEQDDIRFFINEKEVASIDRAGLETDGLYGIRLNHSINIHVSDLNMSGL